MQRDNATARNNIGFGVGTRRGESTFQTTFRWSENKESGDGIQMTRLRKW